METGFNRTDAASGASPRVLLCPQPSCGRKSAHFVGSCDDDGAHSQKAHAAHDRGADAAGVERAGQALSCMYWLTIMHSADPTHTSTCVLRPARLLRISRSRPIMAPQSNAPRRRSAIAPMPKVLTPAKSSIAAPLPYLMYSEYMLRTPMASNPLLLSGRGSSFS